MLFQPRCIFEINQNVSKVSIETKLICTTGNGTLSFWYIYENNVKEFKHSVKNLNIANNNFIDHGTAKLFFENLIVFYKQEIFY